MRIPVEIKKADSFYCAIRKYKEGERPPSIMPGYVVSEAVVATQNPAFLNYPKLSNQFIQEWEACNGKSVAYMDMEIKGVCCTPLPGGIRHHSDCGICKGYSEQYFPKVENGYIVLSVDIAEDSVDKKEAV